VREIFKAFRTRTACRDAERSKLSNVEWGERGPCGHSTRNFGRRQIQGEASDSSNTKAESYAERRGTPGDCYIPTVETLYLMTRIFKQPTVIYNVMYATYGERYEKL
jgi:hypothetical protein